MHQKNTSGEHPKQWNKCTPPFHRTEVGQLFGPCAVIWNCKVEEKCRKKTLTFTQKNGGRDYPPPDPPFRTTGSPAEPLFLAPQDGSGLSKPLEGGQYPPTRGGGSGPPPWCNPVWIAPGGGSISAADQMYGPKAPPAISHLWSLHVSGTYFELCYT